MIKIFFSESISFQMKVIILNGVYYTTIAIAFLFAVVSIYQCLKKIGLASKKSLSFLLTAILLAVPFGYISSKMANMFYYTPDRWNWAFFIQEFMEGHHHTFHASILLPLFVISVLIKLFSFPFWKVWDTIFLFVPMTHAIARVGCLLVGCCWGEIITIQWLDHSFRFKNPVPIYSIGLNLLLFCFLKKRFNRIYFSIKDDQFSGTIVAFYLIIYGVIRFFLEMIRLNPIIAYGLTQAQWAMIGFIIVGSILFLCICLKNFVYQAKNVK